MMMVSEERGALTAVLGGEWKRPELKSDHIKLLL